jgi:hypothetical protein
MDKLTDCEPKYDFNKLKTACKFALNGSREVEINNGAFNDAKSVFGIKNKAELLTAVINMSLSEMKFIQTRNLKKTSEVPPPKVDSYIFVYKFIDGYLAFYLSEYSGRWVIKSFKKYDEEYGRKQTDLGRQLQKLGLI